MNSKKMRRISLAVIMSCSAFLSVAQPQVKTSINKNEILIGQQFDLKIQAVFSGDDFFINWVKVPDTMVHFELIQKSKIDSVFTNQRLTGLSQSFTLTSFDSGKWQLPSFTLNFTPAKGDSTFNMLTDSLPVTVSFSTDDTTTALKDIKPIREASVSNPFWYWAGSLLLLVLLAALMFWWYRRHKKSKKLTPLPSRLSPYEEAMQELELLNAFNLAVPKEVQLYHNKLTAIFRRYLSGREKNNYQNKTTGDILIAVNDNYRDKEILNKVATALRFSDAVKFARYIPLAADSSANKEIIKDIIRLIESLPNNKT